MRETRERERGAAFKRCPLYASLRRIYFAWVLASGDVVRFLDNVKE